MDRSVDPMERSLGRGDPGRMLQFSIRCHPTVPVRTDELEEWLELQIERLRADAPAATLRVSRVSQNLPGTTVDLGWLVEFEVPESEHTLARHHVTSMLADMRLLGFQPTILTPVAAVDWDANGGYALAPADDRG